MQKNTNEKAFEQFVLACFNLRMNLLGHSSYSGTPSKVDKGWAEMIIDRLNAAGYDITKRSQESGG